MKKNTIFILGCLLMGMASCRKDFTRQKNQGYLDHLQADLREYLQRTDFTNLDFSRAIQTKADSLPFRMVRIPFLGKSLTSDFVLVATTPDGHLLQGRIISLEGKESPLGTGTVKRRRFDGEIEVFSLDHARLLSSAIENGFIVQLHPDKKSRSSNYSSDLPEVVVVAYVHPSGVSYSDWMLFTSFFSDIAGDGGGTVPPPYYSPIDGYGTGGGYGGSGANTGSSGPTLAGDDGFGLDTPISPDQQPDSGPAIDVEKYLKCFDNIPDAGATCSITLYTDIPVDNDPTILYSIWNGGRVGHSFIGLKKTNGSQSTLQYIGFYPKNGFTSITSMTPVDGKFVSDSQHEYNASITMNLTPENFRSSIVEIQYLSRFIKYDVDEYNCTDFALDVFNKTRTDKLVIPNIDIPGGMAAGGTRTPQGLYLKLQQMKASGHTEAPNIDIGFEKGWVANSDGPCN